MNSKSFNPMLKNKVAIVTGGSGHLGNEIIKALNNCGVKVMSLDVKKSRLKLGKNFHFEYCDISKKKELEKSINLCIKKFKKIDILINNASFVGDSKLEGWNVPFEQQDEEVWGNVLNVNLTSSFTLSKMVWPFFKKNKNGVIVNISSIYGFLGPNNSLYKGIKYLNNPAAYSASKGGIIQLTRWLSTNMAPFTRVNALAIGGIKRNQPEKFIKRYKELTPLKRMANENDVVGPLLFLVSDLSKYITGQVINVDGGWSAW